MSKATIQDWTETQVQLKFDKQRDVKYLVFRENDTHFIELQELDGAPIHTLELPEGMKLDKASYAVLLRYVLLDVVAA